MISLFFDFQLQIVLKKFFQLNRNQSYYYVICEKHDTEKTILVRIVLREVKQSIIYVEIPAFIKNINDFDIAFEKSLNFAFEKHISFTTQFMKKILGVTNSKLIIIIL